MNSKRKPKIVAISLIILMGGLYYFTRPTISERQKDQLINIQPPDSLILPIREVGYINLKNFTDLVRTIKGFDSSLIVSSKNRDSIMFYKPAEWDEVEFRRVFFNDRDVVNWENRFQNLPISCFKGPKTGFSVKIDSIDHTAYLYLPYEILYSVVRYTSNESN